MIRAPVAARGGRRRSTSVLRSNNADVGSQGRVNIVSVHRDAPTGGVARHVLVQHSNDGAALGPVLGEDLLGPEQTALLAAVEVELEGVGRAEAGLGEDAEGLEDDDGAGAVVVGAGRAGGRRSGRGVVVGSDDDGAGVGAGDGGDDGGLVEGMGHAADGDGRVGRGDAADGVEEPVAGFSAGGGPVVAVVVALTLLDATLDPFHSHQVIVLLGEGAEPALGVGVAGPADQGVGLGNVADRSWVGHGLSGLERHGLLVARRELGEHSIVLDLVSIDPKLNLV